MGLLHLETWVVVLLSMQTAEKPGAASCCDLGTGCQEANFKTKPFGL